MVYGGRDVMMSGKGQLALLWIAVVLANPGACSSGRERDGEAIDAERKKRETELDVFLVGGQSNAAGEGDRSLSPTVSSEVGFQWNSETNDIEEGNDPVGNARTGSAWPAFLGRWHELTGRRAVVVSVAMPTTAQHHLAGMGRDDWDDPAKGGTLYQRAIETLDGALAGIEGRGFIPVFRGVLWDQGSRDAKAIENGLITEADYQRALEAMIERFRAHCGPTMPMWIFRLGRRSKGDTAGWAEVRRAQEAVVVADPGAQIVFRDSIDFPSEGKMKDGVHYSQAGYNEMGRAGAESVARTLFGHPAAGGK